MRLIEFVVAAALIEITPGPNMSYLASTAIARGVRAALTAVAGVAVGLLLVGIAASFGAAELIERYPAAGGILRWGGVLFMLWLAVEGWRDAGRDFEDRGATKFGSFWRGLTTNLLNPKLVVFYLAVVPDFVDEAAGNVLLQNLALIAVYGAVATAAHLGIVLAANRVGSLVVTNARRKAVGRMMACLLVGVAAWLAFDPR